MINTARVGAVIRKEFAEIRRNRLILVTACILPIIFLVEPTVEILLIKASATSATLAARVDTSLFLPLLVPVLIPATMSAFSVVGERERDGQPEAGGDDLERHQRDERHRRQAAQDGKLLCDPGIGHQG